MSAGALVKPMLAVAVDTPFDNDAWVFETKWDGYRVIALVVPGQARLYSRNGLDVTADYPAIAEALAASPQPMVVDGELVALDEQGVARFQLMQQARKEPARLRYCAFDLLLLDGRDLRGLPLTERKTKLKAALPRSRVLIFSEHIVGEGKMAVRAAEAAGLEGVIGKRADSLYHSGRRSPDWIKIKIGKRQEAVIIGFTAPKRAREHFGALLLAVGDDKRPGAAAGRGNARKPQGSRFEGFRFVGHVGSGFSGDDLTAIYGKLAQLKVTQAPVTDLTGIDPRVTTWVKPELVCEVKFSEWTADGLMRHPVFLGLREDKPAADVVQERPRLKHSDPSS